MENSAASIEKLFERIEQYSKTSLDLCKYSAIYETAALFSSLAVKLIMTLVIFIVALLFTIALSLWMGDMLENTAYGFLIMGFFYIVLGVFVFLFRKTWIKTPMSNFVIKSFKLPKH